MCPNPRFRIKTHIILPDHPWPFACTEQILDTGTLHSPKSKGNLRGNKERVLETGESFPPLIFGENVVLRRGGKYGQGLKPACTLLCTWCSGG